MIIIIIIIIIIILLRRVSDIAAIRVSVVLKVLLLTITDFLKVWGKCAETIEWETCRMVPSINSERVVGFKPFIKEIKKSAFCVSLSLTRTWELLRTQKKALFTTCNWLRLNWFRMRLWSKGCQVRKPYAPNLDRLTFATIVYRGIKDTLRNLSYHWDLVNLLTLC